MASYSNTAPVARPGQQVAYGAPAQVPMQMPMAMQAPTAPAGTFAPGTKIQVGDHRVVIQKYLSEGGFAHVYLVKLPRPVDGTDLAVLKRVAVPDKETLRGMRTEVETMKRLKGHRPIVTYIDSHASERKGGGYEVFLLMEYCNGGGLIDFMNTRLQHRLTEPEILNIFSDIAEGVACMHYLKPPLLHRDLKVENVLITLNGSRRRFKLCDFGSAAPPKPAPQTVVECRLLDEDIQRHTTMQYRSPEMIDVYRKQPIDEKSDIWALGVLLYKLCYYTTPFEDQGQLAILNASYRFPSYPVFSDRLKHLIASMLRENLSSRPNIYQVLRESCLMQGREVPIHDIYSERAHSEPRRTEKQSNLDHQGRNTPGIGAVYSPPPQQQAQAIPDIAPMRRGRPAVSNQPVAAHPPKPSPSPMRVTNGDPFAALDSKTGAKGDADELSSRFPTLDQFALLHDHGAKFDFDSPVSPPGQRQSADLSRVVPTAATTEMQRPTPPSAPVQNPASVASKPPSEMSRASAIISSNPELQAIASPPPQPSQETARRPMMVSTGTMTSTTPPERQFRDYPPIHRFPSAEQYRSPSVPPQTHNISGFNQPRPDPIQLTGPSPSSRPPLVQPQPGHGRHTSSSRPSLEGGRPSLEYLEPLAKSSSTTARPRPASTYLESSMDYLREREAAPRPLRSPGLSSSKFPEKGGSAIVDSQDEAAIESNVDFLRSMEDSDSKKKDKSSKHHHAKRSSLGSLSGTKHILAGKFGDAFKRFEGGTGSGARTPSPLKDMERHDLTPIAGSEATDGLSDDGHLSGEPEMTPEMRRELEAQSAAEEERRVEAAAAEYKQRMAERDSGGPTALPKSIGGVSRAVSIQNRVQNLLDESQKSSQQVQRTATGYGKFSDEATAQTRVEKQPPEVPRKPTGSKPAPPLKPAATSESLSRGRPAGQVPDVAPLNRPVPPSKPNPAPKPTHLNKIPTGSSRARSPPKQRQPGPSSSSDLLVGVDLPGRPVLDMSFEEKEDYISDFSKRFPSLSSIEMVERDIDAEVDRKGGR
ncbi:kinase-like domain-containing protein [Camillea tinctor]|nr:kinase-like domain-containing protein [Camillea tinctor]